MISRFENVKTPIVFFYKKKKRNRNSGCVFVVWIRNVSEMELLLAVMRAFIYCHVSFREAVVCQIMNSEAIGAF